MKGLDFMKITTEIATTDEKAAFIAENMELIFDSVLDDLDIEYYYIIDCKFYAVEIVNCDKCIYADYDDACSVYNDMVDDFENPSGGKYSDVRIGDIVTISEIDVSHTGFIKSSELDAATLSDIFDDFVATKNEKIATNKTISIAVVTKDGIVER